MGSVTYIAVDRGKLVAGHSEGTEYSIDVDFETFDPSTTRETDETSSISGRVVTVYHRKDETASLATIWLKNASLQAELIEFLESVVAGEEFTLDPYGTALAPVEPILATLSGDFSKSRHRFTETWKFRFDIKVIQ